MKFFFVLWRLLGLGFIMKNSLFFALSVAGFYTEDEPEFDLISFVNACMYHTISLLQYTVVSKYRVTVTVKVKEKIKLWLP